MSQLLHPAFTPGACPTDWQAWKYISIIREYIYIYISLIIQYVDTEKCLAEVHFIGQPCWQAPSVSEGDKNTIIGGTY